MLVLKAAAASSNTARRTSPEKTEMTLSTSLQAWLPDVRVRPLAIATKPALGEKLALVAKITSVNSARANADR